MKVKFTLRYETLFVTHPTPDSSVKARILSSKIMALHALYKL